jgi:hypothetical protein
MSMNDISPRAVLDRSFRLWPAIVLAIVICGMVGWLVGSLLSPIYETHAQVLINLDSNLWAQEAHLESPFEIAIANSLRPIYALFYSEATINALMVAAQTENISLDINQIQTMFTIQRADLALLLTVRSSDPVTSARLANLWVQAALPLFQPAHEHALAAFALTRQRDGVSACFENAALSTGNTCAGTSYDSLSDLAPALDNLDAQIAAEQVASLDLDPAMTLELVSPAAVPGEPERYQRTWLALAGTLIGVVLGFVITQIPIRIRKGNVRVE